MGTDIEIIKNRLDQFGRDLTLGLRPLDPADEAEIAASLYVLAQTSPHSYNYYRAALATIPDLSNYLSNLGLALQSSAMRFAERAPGSGAYLEEPSWQLLGQRLAGLRNTLSPELREWYLRCGDLIRSRLPEDWRTRDVQLVGEFVPSYTGYLSGIYSSSTSRIATPLAIRFVDRKPTAALFMTKRGGLRELRKEAAIALDAVTSAAPEAQHTHANPRWTVSRLITSRRSVRPAGRAAESMTRRIVK